MRSQRLVAICLAVACALPGQAAAQLTSSNASLAFGKDEGKRRQRPFVANPGTATITAPLPVVWDPPTEGTMYANVAAGGFRPGQLLEPGDLAGYVAASIDYEAPNHPYIIQEIDQGGTIAITARLGGAPISTNVEYGRMKIGIALAPGVTEIELGRPMGVVISVPGAFAPITQLRIDFGTRVSVPELGGTGRVFTVQNPINPRPLLVTWPGDYGSSTIEIKAVATTGSFTQANPNGADGSGLQADGAVVSGAATFPAVPGRPGGVGGPLVGQATPSSGALHFGKERGVRGSIAVPAVVEPSQMTVTAAGPAIWDLPSVGSLYAVPGVSAVPGGQLLFQGNIATYNASTPTVVIYEAPNHPYVIQALDEGGMTNVTGVLAAGPGGPPTTARFNVQVPYGRDHIKIEAATDDGKVVLGVRTRFVFTFPSTFVPPARLRIDFGTEVIGPDGTVGRMFILPAMAAPIEATYPPTYGSSTVVVKAVLTTGIFLVDPAQQIDGSGLQANGATVSGVGSFQIEKPPPMDLIVTKVASRNVIAPDQEVTYTITVTNPANYIVRNVVIWDSHLGEVDRTRSLMPGASQEVSRTTTLTSRTRNVARASATDPFGNTVNGTSDEVVVDVVNPRIAVTVQPTMARAKFGMVIDYNFTVENTGDVTLSAVALIDDVLGPVGTVGTLPKDGGRQAFLVRRAFPRGTASPVRNTVTATGIDLGTGGSATDQASATVDLIETGMTVTITPNKPKVKSGGQVTYTVVVKNTGGGPLSNLSIVDDQLGNLGTNAELAPGAEDVRTIDSAPTVTRTHTTRATGTDEWGDPVAAEGGCKVEVVSPALGVTITANGSSNVVRVPKGDPVNFAFTVTNSGDCALQNVTVRFNGGTLDTYDVPIGTTKIPAPQTLKVDKDSKFDVSASGRDETGDPISASDVVRVEVSNTVSTALGALGVQISNANRLLDEIDQLVTKMRQTHKDFDARLGINRGAGVRPCDDEPARLALQTAASIRARFDTVLGLLDGLIQDIMRESTNVGTAIKGAAQGVDPLDLLGRYNTAKVDKKDEVKKHHDDMASAWKAAGCGDAPKGKERIVTIAGKVLDAKGKPIDGADVVCGGKNLKSGPDGGFTLVLPLDTGDNVEAVGAVDKDGFRFAGSGAANYTGGDPLPLLVTIDTSPMRSVKITGVVRDAAGNPLPTAKVEGKDTNGGYYEIDTTAELGKPVNVKATVEIQSGSKKETKGGTGVTPQFKGEPTLSVDITIAGAVLPQKFDVTGSVLDGKNNGIESVKVTAPGGAEATTLAGGTYSLSLQGVVDQSFAISASWTDKNNKQLTGGTTVVYKGGTSVSAPAIVLSEGAQPFTVSGQVLYQGNPLEGASVTVGTLTGQTRMDGRFSIGPLKEDVGTMLAVDVSKSIDGVDKGTHGSVTYQGGTSLDAGTLAVGGGPPSDKPVSHLTIAPANPKVEIGKTLHFVATAVYADQTSANVTENAEWGNADKGTFVGWSVGTGIEIKVTYGDKSAATSVDVKEPDLGAAIDSTASGASPCSMDELKQKFGQLERDMAAVRGVARDFGSGYAKFNKEINDQNSPPCKNGLLAAAYVGCKKHLAEYKQRAAAAKGLARDVIALKGRCPNLLAGGQQPPGAYDGEGLLRELGDTEERLGGEMNDMTSRLNTYGCDPAEVVETGNQTANNGQDPNVIGDGGSGAKEICGDGIDNDGDGLQDEDCAGQTGANISIALFDSGNAKDDVFDLEVAGRGLGVTPAGGLRNYALTLSPGTYTATVTVITAPDNIGTFTITIFEGGRAIGGTSGSPPVGGGASVNFTVGAPATSVFFEPDPSTITYDELGAGGKR